MDLAFDISHPEHLAHDLGELNRVLARERDAPEWISREIRDLCAQIADADHREAPALDLADFVGLQKAALHAQSALLDEDDADPAVFRRRIRRAIEELRFRAARLAEHDSPIDDESPKALVQWLDKQVRTTDAEKGRAVGVSDRTWQRWTSDDEASEPSGEQATRVTLLARLVSQLGPMLTPYGALQWALRPLPDLGGSAPVDVLGTGDLEAVGKVFAVVSSARAGAAS